MQVTMVQFSNAIDKLKSGIVHVPSVEDLILSS